MGKTLEELSENLGPRQAILQQVKTGRYQVFNIPPQRNVASIEHHGWKLVKLGSPRIVRQAATVTKDGYEVVPQKRRRGV